MTLDLRDRIRDVPDFPTEGVVFKDIMPLIADRDYFKAAIDELAEWVRPREPDLILGAEARGFIFGAALAYAVGAGFIAARKPGKLPRETIQATYALEYGTDSLQVHRDAITPGSRVVVLDDGGRIVLRLSGTGTAGATLRVYLARHGQTDWNAAHRMQGQTDIELNATGRQQAELLRERVADIPLDHVYSSTLRRSRETAIHTKTTASTRPARARTRCSS